MGMPGKEQIEVSVSFYSFFKDLAGCAGSSEVMPVGSKLADLVALLSRRFPKLEPMRRSMLLAVGVEYQDGSYVLKDGDEVSLFPPVQGG
jgi:molybdopterin synthase sulfur carrier subunit